MKFEEWFDEVDESAYHAKLRSCTVAELRAEETRKMRQFTNGSMSVGAAGSAAWVDPTGIALVSGLYSGRATYVADTKLELIRDELRQRGLAPRSPNMNDWVVAGASFAGGQIVGNDEQNWTGNLGNFPSNALGQIEGEYASDNFLESYQHLEDKGRRASPVSKIVTIAGRSYKTPLPSADCPYRKHILSMLRCNSCSRYFDPRFGEWLRKSESPCAYFQR